MFDPTSELERHVPEHPLPNEIKEMPHDATVCKFCGVSYLIHHEMKKLEEKVARLERDLVGYQELRLQEQFMSDEIEKSKCTIKSLETNAADKDRFMELMSKDFEQIKIENETLKKELEETKDALLEAKENLLSDKRAFSDSLKRMQDSLSAFKTEYLQIKESTKNFVPMCSDIVTATGKKLLKEINFQFNGFENIEENYQMSLKELDILKNVNDLKRESSSKLKREVEELQKVNDRLSFQFVADGKKLTFDVNELKKDNSELTGKVEKLEKENRFKNSKLVEVDYNLRAKQEELDEFKVKSEQFLETSKFTIKRLEEEQRNAYMKTRQAEEDISKLMASLNEKDARITSLLSQVDFVHEKCETLEKTLDETRENVHKLIVERETMAAKHQSQLGQLSIDFEEKLKQIQSNDVELQEMKKHMRLEYEEKLGQMKNDLNAEHNIDCEIRSNEVASLQRKHKLQLIEMEKEYQVVFDAHSRDLSTCKHNLQMSVEELKEKEREFNREKHSLKNTISELQDKLGKVVLEKHNSENIMDLKATKDKLMELEELNSELNQRSISQTLQIQKLEDTVRRECEERFELLQALNDAQNKLINKKNQKMESENCGNPDQGEGLVNMPVSAINTLFTTYSHSNQNNNNNNNHRVDDSTSSSSGGYKLQRSSSSRQPQQVKVNQQRSQTVLPVLRKSDHQQQPNSPTKTNKTKHHKHHRSGGSSNSDADQLKTGADFDVNFLRRRIAEAIKRR